MSSTYIRDICVYKTEHTPYYTRPEYKQDIFAVLLDSAESNVFNTDGGLSWSWDVATVGTWDDVFHAICKSAAYFEGGMNQWKPKQIKPESFIKKVRQGMMCATFAEKLPKNFSIAWLDLTNPVQVELSQKLSTLPEIKSERWYNQDRICTNDFIMLYELKIAFSKCNKYYAGDFTKYIREHNHCYAPAIVNLFAEKVDLQKFD